MPLTFSVNVFPGCLRTGYMALLKALYLLPYASPSSVSFLSTISSLSLGSQDRSVQGSTRSSAICAYFCFIGDNGSFTYSVRVSK